MSTIKSDIDVIINIANEENDEDLLEFVNDILGDCRDYINSVYTMEYQIQLSRFRDEPDVYRNRVMELDRARRYQHNALIGSIDSLVKLAQKMGLAFQNEFMLKIASGNSNGRDLYSEMAREVAVEYFSLNL